MTDDVREMLSREAAEAEGRADAEERGDVDPLPGQRARNQSGDAAQVYSIRLPGDRINELRELAKQRSEAPTVLMRRWVLERLDEELDRVSSSNAEAGTDLLLSEIRAAVRSVLYETLELTGAVEHARDGERSMPTEGGLLIDE